MTRATGRERGLSRIILRVFERQNENIHDFVNKDEYFQKAKDEFLILKTQEICKNAGEYSFFAAYVRIN